MSVLRGNENTNAPGVHRVPLAAGDTPMIATLTRPPEFLRSSPVESARMTGKMFAKMLPLTLLAAVLSASAVCAADTKLVSSSTKPADKPVAKPPRKEGTKWDLMEHG